VNFPSDRSYFESVFDLAVLVSLFAGGSFFYFFVGAYRSDAQRTRRVLRKAKVTPIAQLEDGQLACIVGVVELEGEPLVSMITRLPCVAYDTTIQMFRGNDYIPERVDVTRKLVPFTVVDGTGRVRIDAPQAALCNRATAKSERFEERVIETGALIRIVGSVRVDPERSLVGERTYREGSWHATLTGTSKYPLLIDVER
jgi:hypothetical protein